MFNSSNSSKKNSLEGNADAASGSSVPSTSSAVLDDVWMRNDAALAAQQEQVMRLRRLREKKARAAMSKEAQIQRAKERFSQMHKSTKRELRQPEKFKEAPPPPPLFASWNQVAREEHDQQAAAAALVAPIMVDKAVQTDPKSAEDEQLECPPCLRMHYKCNAHCKHIPKHLKIVVPYCLLRKSRSKYIEDAQEQERMRIIDRLCNPFGKKKVPAKAASVTVTVSANETQETEKTQQQETQTDEVTAYMREFPALSDAASRGRSK